MSFFSVRVVHQDAMTKHTIRERLRRLEAANEAQVSTIKDLEATIERQALTIQNLEKQLEKRHEDQ